VVFSNTHKAALLLASLDPRASAELLKAARPELLTEIATELVRLEAGTSVPDRTGPEPAVDFYMLLQKTKGGGEAKSTGVRRLLETAVGKQRSEEILSQARKMMDSKDPFLAIRDASVESLAEALATEHPQVAAVVLMELPIDKSAALMPLLVDATRREAVRRMTCGESVSPEARARVAAMIRDRMEAARKAEADPVAPVAAAATAGPQQPVSAKVKAKAQAKLRQVALLLRNLAVDLRDTLVKSLGEHNAQQAETIRDLMVMWPDVPTVSDRNIQEVLRSVDARKLAMALVEAEPAIAAKIRGNISERARAMIDEETQLMKTPKPQEIEEAREAILGYLRQLNAKGELKFEGK
jgi:flagellar motor switch protein FliG